MERTVGAKLLKFNSGAAIKTKVLSKYHPCLPILIHSVLSVAFDEKANAYILNLGNIWHNAKDKWKKSSLKHCKVRVFTNKLYPFISGMKDNFEHESKQKKICGLCSRKASKYFIWFSELYLDSSCMPSIRDGVLRSGMLLYLHLILE